MKEKDYSQYYELKAIGDRIGLCICLKCGATVLLGDKDCDSTEIHEEWHKNYENR